MDEGRTIALNSLARLVVSPIVKDEIYLYDGENQWYRSTDSGLTWITKTLPVESFIFDGEDPNILYGWGPNSGTSLHTGKRSRDGGATWEDWPQQPCVSYSYNDPVSFLAPIGHAQMFFFNCGGILRTDNGGDSWRKMTDEVGQPAVDYGTPGRLLLAKEDGLWASSNLGESWHRLLPNYLPVATMPLYLPSLKSMQ